MERTKYKNSSKIEVIPTNEIKVNFTKVSKTKNGIRLLIDISLNKPVPKTKQNRAKDIILYNNIKKIYLSEGPFQGKNCPTVQERTRKYLPLANQLAKTVLTKKNMKYPQSQINQWADEIRRLAELTKISYERIEKALDWYEDHIGGEYIPTIESGYSLRKKFLALENAMDREKTSFSNGKPKSKYIGGRKYDLCPDGQYRNVHGELYIE